MKAIELTALVPAPPERVFDVLTDHEGMARWTDAREVVLRHPGSPPPNGVGAIRVIRARGVAIEEEIVVYDRPKRIEYRLTAGLPIRDHSGEILLEPEGSGTRVLWRVRFRPLVPGSGWLLRSLLERTLSRTLTQLAAHLGSA